MEHNGSPRWAPVALWLPLVAFAAALALQKIRTFDYWWHLRTGALIAETGAVPTVDPYTYTVAGERWIDIHWLHQLALHGLYSLGGHAAVVVGKLVLVLALLAILARIGYRRERAIVSVVALALMLAVACDRFMPRPELPSFVMLAAVLALFDRFTRRGDAWVYAVVAVQLVWVNVHGLFGLGLAVCAIYLVAELLRPAIAPSERLRPARVRRLAAVTALSVGVSLANPNLLEGALYPLQQLTMVGPAEDRGIFGSLIAELIPPTDPHASQPVVLALAAILATLSFAAMALNWRRIHGSDPLLWVAFAYLALGAQRNLALFAIVAAPILIRNLNGFLGELLVPRLVRAAPAALVSLGLLALSVDAARGSFYPRLGSLREPGLGVMEDLYPMGAAEWIAQESPPGPICHHMAGGGYLIWRLHPDYPVMVDGRLEVFGPEKFIELQAGHPARFRALDAEYRFGVVLVQHSLVDFRELLWWLYLNSNWRLAFVDDAAAVFVRVRDGDWSRESELDVDAPDLFPPLGETTGLRDRIKRFARTSFYTAFRRYDVALALWRETLERYPNLPQGPMVHAALLHKNGLPAAAEAILRSLLAESPKDPALHALVGDLRLESGDGAAAVELFDAALALDPKFRYALLRRGQIAESEGDAQKARQLYERIVWQSPFPDRVAVQAWVRMRVLGGGI